jgi:hypothetical protein
MLLIKQFTGISPLLIVTIISLALGIIYSLIGMIGGAIGGIISSLTK